MEQEAFSIFRKSAVLCLSGLCRGRPLAQEHQGGVILARAAPGQGAVEQRSGAGGEICPLFQKHGGDLRFRQGFNRYTYRSSTRSPGSRGLGDELMSARATPFMPT